jgi:lipoprotein-anchoring transpeptidase ErfK/SrfK
MPITNTTRYHAEQATLIFAIFFLLSLPGFAQVASDDKRLLLISIPDHSLALIQDGQVERIYPVATGKQTTPSPTGAFRIVVRVVDPTYYHEGKVVAPGPRNPLGNRWMGLDRKGYGIHGTNAPQSIGRSASHGCIRMAKRDLEELFTMVKVGDEVQIRGERDAQTAAIFGNDSPAQPQSAVAVAQDATTSATVSGQ